MRKKVSAKILTTKERQSFEQSVLRNLKNAGAENATILVATSGGVDSMVLLETIKQWQRTLNTNLAVAYIHHGYSPGHGHPNKKSLQSKKQSKYRDEAKATVENYCEEHGIRFITNSRLPKGLKSEDDFRKFRWAKLSELADRVARRGAEVLIATAHHADDLIETQLLRLLRGTGSQGLKGFSERDALGPDTTKTTQSDTSRAANPVSGSTLNATSTPKSIIRPLLQLPKNQIEAYARSKKLKFAQDPSNQQTDALRNWLRKHWLKPLSTRDKLKSTNLKKSLAGSLAALGKEGVKQEWPKNLFQKASLHTPTFLTLSKTQKEAALATFMNDQCLKNYTKNHIAEILKRLDTNAKELKFRLLGREWKITAQHISHGRLDVPSE